MLRPMFGIVILKKYEQSCYNNYMLLFPTKNKLFNFSLFYYYPFRNDFKLTYPKLDE